MPVTLKDVAASAGVSVSTVSQVLRKTENNWISESTKERVRQAAQDLGYRANPAARLLAARKGHYFAIVVRNVKSMIMLDPIAQVSNQALKAGYTPFVVETVNLPRSHYDNIESLADAVVFIGTGDKEFCRRITQFDSGIAAVVATRPVQSRFPEFIWDEAAGFDLVLDHLIDQGHRRFALLGGVEPTSNSGNRERLNTFQKACEARGIEPLIVSSNDETDRILCGKKMMDTLLKQNPDITAVIGRNIEFSIGALARCQHRGLQLPRDLSLVSYTDSPIAEGIWPRLTALRTPIREATERAASAVLDILAGKSIEPISEVLPIQFVPGQTTGPPRKHALTTIN